jgi:hypothetical protein
MCGLDHHGTAFAFYQQRQRKSYSYRSAELAAGFRPDELATAGDAATVHLSVEEKPMNSSRLIWLGTALAVVASLCLLPTPAYAQKDAGAKVRGEHSVPFWSSRSSARRITAARDYARDFQSHIAVNPKPEPAVVKEVTKEIGNNLDEARKHLAQLKKDFAGNKDRQATYRRIRPPQNVVRVL